MVLMSWAPTFWEINVRNVGRNWKVFFKTSNAQRRKIMAQTEVKKLDNGDLFPKMEFKLTDGTAVTLPEKESGNWCVLLVYRGRW
jgi:hypothetical protein